MKWSEVPQDVIDEGERDSVGDAVRFEPEQLWVETPSEGKWAGVEVLPRNPDALVEQYVTRAKRTANWMRTTTENLQYVEDDLVSLAQRARAVDMRIRRAWDKVCEADSALSDPVWVESLPRKAGQMRTQRIENMGRVLVAVTELAEVWDEYARKYEEVTNEAFRGVYG